jgi:hypothetical protein
VGAAAAAGVVRRIAVVVVAVVEGGLDRRHHLPEATGRRTGLAPAEVVGELVDPRPGRRRSGAAVPRRRVRVLLRDEVDAEAGAVRLVARRPASPRNVSARPLSLPVLNRSA